MATKSGGLTYFDDGGEVSSEPQSKQEKTKGGVGYGVLQGGVPVSQSVLQSMADLYNQKMSERHGFLESLKTALMVPYPQAMLEREKQLQAQDVNLGNIRLQLAQAAAQKEALKQSDIEDIASGWKPAPITGAQPAPITGAQPAPITGTQPAPAEEPQPAPIGKPTTPFGLTPTPGVDIDAVIKQYNYIKRYQGIDAANKFRSEFLKDFVKQQQIGAQKPEEVKTAEYIESLPDGHPTKEMFKRRFFKESYGIGEEVEPSGTTRKYNIQSRIPSVGAPAAPVGAPAAPVGAPAGTTPGMIGSLPAGSVSGVEQRSKDYERSQNVFFDTVAKPLSTQVVAAQPVQVEINNALNMLDNTEVGPGTSIKMALTEAKSVFSKMTPKQQENLINLKTIDQAQKTLVASGIRAAYGAQLSDKEGDRFTKTLFTINDPKQFIRATLELRRANNAYNERMLEFINQHPHNTAVELDKFKKSGIYDQIIKEYAPTVYAEFEKRGTTPTAVTKPKTSTTPTKGEEIEFGVLPKRGR